MWIDNCGQAAASSNLFGAAADDESAGRLAVFRRGGRWGQSRGRQRCGPWGRRAESESVGHVRRRRRAVQVQAAARRGADGSISPSRRLPTPIDPPPPSGRNQCRATTPGSASHSCSPHSSPRVLNTYVFLFQPLARPCLPRWWWWLLFARRAIFVV